MNKSKPSINYRRGNIAVLLCFLLPPLLSLVALAVDYGFLLYIRTELQRAADQAAIAAVRELEPTADGFQDLDRVRATVREFVELNSDSDFTVLDSDIEIGRFDPTTIYTSVDILDNGIFDTVRVSLRRDDLANSSVSLFFARLFGSDTADVSATATAVLQKAKLLTPGTDILPFAIPVNVWDSKPHDELWSIYGDGRLEDQFGNQIPGNWGTLDIGSQSNSASDLVDQINHGLRQQDVDALYGDGTIPNPDYIDSQLSISLNGDTGLSSGLRSAVQSAHGTRKIAPIFSTFTGQGGSVEYQVVKWGVVEVVDSRWNGNNKTYVEIKKAYIYDSDLRPHPDLSNTTDVIDSAFTSPVLVE
jgi:hypothetical protein